MEQPNTSIGEKFKSDLEGAVCDIKARGDSVLQNEKSRLVHGLHGVVNALDESARQLRQSKDPSLASYIELASDKLDQAGQYIERANARDVVRDFGAIARRNRLITFGGMFLAGVGLARVIKNMSDEESTRETSVPPSTPSQPEERGENAIIHHIQAS